MFSLLQLFQLQKETVILQIVCYTSSGYFLTSNDSVSTMPCGLRVHQGLAAPEEKEQETPGHLQGAVPPCLNMVGRAVCW